MIYRLFTLVLSTYLVLVGMIFTAGKANANEVYSGRVESVFIETNSKSRLLHKIVFTDGSKKILVVPKNNKVDFRANDSVEVKGKIKGKKLFVKSIKLIGKKRTQYIDHSHSQGDKKVLVVKASDTKFTVDKFNSSMTTQTLNDIFFTSNTSLKTYLAEASNNKLNITGDVMDTIYLDNFCNEDTFFESDADVKVINYLDAQGVNLSQYNYLSIIVPDTDCASGTGIGTVGRQTHLTSQGTISIAVQFTKSRTDLQAVRRTVFHEVGHNLGLFHANASICGSDIFNSSTCPGLEYGGAAGIMGAAIVLGHYNSVFKQGLQWLDTNNEVQSISSSQLHKNIKLYSYNDTSVGGLKVIKIPRADGKFYHIEHRNKSGFEALKSYNTSKTFDYEGINIYLDDGNYGYKPVIMTTGLSDYRASSSLITSGTHDYYSNTNQIWEMYKEVIFNVGEEFHDPISNIKVAVTAVANDFACIKVNIGGNPDDGTDEKCGLDSGDNDNNNNNDDDDNNDDNSNNQDQDYKCADLINGQIEYKTVCTGNEEYIFGDNCSYSVVGNEKFINCSNDNDGNDDGDDDQGNNNGNTGTGNQDFSANFTNITDGSEVVVGFKKTTSALVNINANQSVDFDDARFLSVGIPKKFRKMLRFGKKKRVRFWEDEGLSRKVRIQSARKLAKRGILPDDEGFYSFELEIRDETTKEVVQTLKYKIKADL
jgi:ribosomal protein L13